MELASRLDNVIKKDKQINPQYMKDIIKSDIWDQNFMYRYSMSKINVDKIDIYFFIS